MSTTTNSGVDSEVNVKAALHFDSPEDAAETILKGWEDEDNESSSSTTEEKPKDPSPRQQEESEGEVEEDLDVEETNTDPEEGDEEDTETEDDSEEPEGEEKDSKTLDDDATVEVKVDDEVLKVSVKDLKRLYGQEAALTKKSQQVAAKRKEVEQEGIKTAAILDKMYNKAAERWKPYAEIDMLVASKQLDNEAFAALRAEAQAAYEDFRFVSEEANAFVQETQAQQQAKLKEAAAEAVTVLKEAIPNWSNSLYDSIREYAISTGMQADVVNNLVDPVAIQLIHKARLYDEAKKIATKKKVNTPKKVMKSTALSNPKGMDNSQKQELAANRLKNSGDMDDAADLFLSRWTDDR
jgi:hypothetical protein